MSQRRIYRSAPLLLLILLTMFAVAGRADTFYAASGPTSSLYTVNTTNGAATLIGPTGVGLTDIALSSGGVLYGNSFTELYILNKTTGTAAPVGALGFDDVNGLAFDGGTLFASTLGGQLLTVNTGTGHATSVGNIGFSSSGDLAACGSGFYMTASAAGGGDQLVSINTGTGAGTAIGGIGFNQVYGLGCDQGGQLFGLTGFGQLISINSTTGAGTLTGVNGISWYGATIVPEPSTLLLLGGGTLALLGIRRKPRA